MNKKQKSSSVSVILFTLLAFVLLFNNHGAAAQKIPIFSSDKGYGLLVEFPIPTKSSRNFSAEKDLILIQVQSELNPSVISYLVRHNLELLDTKEIERGIARKIASSLGESSGRKKIRIQIYDPAQMDSSQLKNALLIRFKYSFDSVENEKDTLILGAVSTSFWEEIQDKHSGELLSQVPEGEGYTQFVVPFLWIKNSMVFDYKPAMEKAIENTLLKLNRK